MKAIIKTDPETLYLLQKIANTQKENVVRNSIEAKAMKSMKTELFIILTKRCFVYSENPNGKKLQLTLKYHLAALLYEMITSVIVYRKLGTFEHNKLELFKNELHQKLL